MDNLGVVTIKEFPEFIANLWVFACVQFWEKAYSIFKSESVALVAEL